MQPSAPLTTDWSTSATVPEQTSAWGKGQSQAGSRIYWAWHAQDQGVELSPCSQDTGTQGTRRESASRTAGRQARACARPAAWTTQARACALQSHCRRGHRHTRDMQGVLPEPPKPGARPAAGRGAPADVRSSLRPPAWGRRRRGRDSAAAAQAAGPGGRPPAPWHGADPGAPGWRPRPLTCSESWGKTASKANILGTTAVAVRRGPALPGGPAARSYRVTCFFRGSTFRKDADSAERWAPREGQTRSTTFTYEASGSAHLSSRPPAPPARPAANYRAGGAPRKSGRQARPQLGDPHRRNASAPTPAPGHSGSRMRSARQEEGCLAQSKFAPDGTGPQDRGQAGRGAECSSAQTGSWVSRGLAPETQEV